MIERETLDTQEAAKMLHVTVDTLRNWLSENRYGIQKVAYKVGGRWLFLADELIRWIQEHQGEKNAPDNQ
jgi:excisionase family DNA binding protein